jgi:hypothetical protein
MTPHKPLFGHRAAKQATTHWIVFMKPNAQREAGAVAPSLHADVREGVDK